VNIPITASGIGTVRLTASLAGVGDAQIDQNFTLGVEPANPPVTRRMAHTVEANGGGITVSKDLIAEMVPDTGAVSLSVGPFSALDVPSLLRDLDRYPYGCSEQLVSRALPLLYLSELGGNDLDLDGSVKLFIDILGFNLTEQIVADGGKLQIAAFLACSNKAHDVAFIRQPVKNRLHHASFQLGSWNEVLRAADIISKRKVPLDLGPTRHGITRGETIYFFDPSGNRCEVFAEGYVHYPDTPTLTWDTDEGGHATFSQDNVVRESFLQVLT
jgi:hypothetical protein